MKGNYKIPFRDGHQLHYADWFDFERENHRAVLRENEVFEDTLEYVDMHRGRSAAYFEMRRASNGKTVTVFMIDFTEMFKHASKGKVTGKFTFCKRGANYGCRLAEGA